MSKVIYPKEGAIIRSKDHPDGELVAEDAKAMLGWQEEKGNEDWGAKFAFQDKNGKKIRLLKVTTNRPVDVGVADQWANVMLHKRWLNTGEAIVVSKTGTIMDGQHRLIGLVFAEQLRQKNDKHYKSTFGWRTQVSIYAWINTGVDDTPEVRKVLNSGRKQTLANRLYRQGNFKEGDTRSRKQLCKVKASCLTVLVERLQYKTNQEHKQPNEVIAQELADEYQSIDEAVEFIVAMNKEANDGIKRRIDPGKAAALMYLMMTVNTDSIKWLEHGVSVLNFKGVKKAKEFWEGIATGENLQKANPISVLREELVKPDLNRGDGTTRRIVVMMFIKAFNLWIEGKTCTPKQLKIKEGKHAVTGDRVILEMPRLGGIDIEREKPEDQGPDEEEVEAAAAEEPAKKPQKGGKGHKGHRGRKERDWSGEWAWVADETPWKGKVKLVEGQNATVTAEDGKNYSVAVTALRDDKPE